MTAVEKQLSNYFGSLNSITRKVCQDKENFIRAYERDEGNWNALDEDDQDALLENYLVDSTVREKYKNIERDVAPPMFPKFVINSGEKIVVDFEHDDGWTWRDEHSGPFSWMTKSQQDLTLDDLDSLEETTSKQKSRGKSRSPDRENGSRRTRDPPFMNQDKPKGTNAEAASTADEIFQKFGIAFSFGNDKDQGDGSDADSMLKEVLSPIEESKLLPGQEEYQNEHLVFDGDYGTEQNSSTYDSSFRDESISEAYMSSDVNSISKRDSTASISTRSSSSSRSRKKDKSKPRTQSNHSEAEVSLMDSDHEEFTIPEVDRGHVSPVYIEDPGESTTDPRDSVMSSSRYSYTDTLVMADSPSVLGSDRAYTESVSSFASGVISEQPTGSVNIADVSLVSSDNIDEWNANLINEQDDEDDSTMKTGFDFLDNW